MITVFLFVAAYVVQTVLLVRRINKLQIRINAVDVAAETVFEYVGGDVGELFERVQDLEAGNQQKAAASTETVNEAVDRLTETNHGG